MVSTGTRQAATSRKRAASGIAPRKSASGGYNDGVGGWKWEMSDKVKKGEYQWRTSTQNYFNLRISANFRLKTKFLWHLWDQSVMQMITERLIKKVKIIMSKEQKVGQGLLLLEYAM